MSTIKRTYVVFALLALLGNGLTGCHSVPKTNLAYDLFPAALLAEPIQMRAGVEHITQASALAPANSLAPATTSSASKPPMG